MPYVLAADAPASSSCRRGPPVREGGPPRLRRPRPLRRRHRFRAGRRAGLLDPAYLRARAADRRATAQHGRVAAGRAAGDEAELPVATRRPAAESAPRTSRSSTATAMRVAMTTTIEDEFGARLMVRRLPAQQPAHRLLVRAADDGKPVANRVAAAASGRARRWRRRSCSTATGRARARRRLARRQRDHRLRRQDAGRRCSTGTSTSSSRDRAAELRLAATVRLRSRSGQHRRCEARAALRARGHEVREIDMASGLQGDRPRHGDGQLGWAGGADPRREGVALGD